MANPRLWGTNQRGALIRACDLESASLILTMVEHIPAPPLQNGIGQPEPRSWCGC